MSYYLINSNGCYYKTVSKEPNALYVTVRPPQLAIDELKGENPPAQSARWDNGSWSLVAGTPMTGAKPAQVMYRTEVTAQEFIDLWSNEHWGEAVVNTNAIVVDFVTKLQNYQKTFDTGAGQVTTGMTAVVQNTSMTQAEGLQIVKGVRL